MINKINKEKKQTINKIDKGNLWKTRQTNKSRGKSTGVGNHEIHGQIEGPFRISKAWGPLGVDLTPTYVGYATAESPSSAYTSR